MTATRSKKPSAKTAYSAPPPRPASPFFVDRTIGRRIAVDALRAAGYTVIAHDELFTQDTADTAWLAEAGREGWIVITADRRIRYRADERDAFKAHGVRAIFLTSGNMTGPQIAELLVCCAPRIQEVVGGVTPPVAFTLTKDGRLSPLALGGNLPAEESEPE